MEVVAVIPARGGSKGVPRKNLAKLRGQTLVALAVGCARRADFGRVLVSTDDPEIAAEAEVCGAEVPALRPREISGDSARTLDAVLHVLRAAECRAEAVAILQPTSPLRRAADLREAEVLLRGRPDAEAVVSVAALEDPHPHKVKRIDSGWLEPYIPGAASEMPRQELPPAYRLSGVIYLVRSDVVVAKRTLMPARSLPLVLPAERSLNIDDPWDLILAEALLERGAASLDADS